MTTHGRKGSAPCGPEGHGAPVHEQEPTKIRIRPRLNAELVDQALRLGLDLSRIVDDALIREIKAERRQRQPARVQDRDGGDGTGSGTTETLQNGGLFTPQLAPFTDDQTRFDHSRDVTQPDFSITIQSGDHHDRPVQE